MTKRLWLSLVGSVLVILLAFWFSSEVSKNRQLTAYEAVLLQWFTMAGGGVLTAIFAFVSAEDAARALLRVRVASAFRRVVSLNRALARFTSAVENHRTFLLQHTDGDGKVSADLMLVVLEAIQTQIAEHADTAADALNDWRDLAPDEVRRIEQGAQRQVEDDS